jgi:signal transduction histidine kinase/DNA-binding NarL/FixJ family response regulator
MAKTRNRFTAKILFSYVALATLAVIVGIFVYSEYKNYLLTAPTDTGELTLTETGTLINLVYETDGLSRLALLTQEEAHYDRYRQRTRLLYAQLADLRSLTSSPEQKAQLDSVQKLLTRKEKNIEQLRLLKITNRQDSSLDDILDEFSKLESTMGKLTVASFVNNPAQLSLRERQVFQSLVDLLNQEALGDTGTVRTKTVDSMLSAARYIVAEAKRENSRARQSLQQKENELIRNDLTLSSQLRDLITAFDKEVSEQAAQRNIARQASVHRTTTVLRIAAIAAVLLIIVFSYFILNDFFKAERYKTSLQQANAYTAQLLKSREQLIATVSHDLKTPLHTITGYAALASNTSLTQQQERYLVQITENAQYIGKLVDDLLDFSKLEAGKLSLERVPFYLKQLIEQTARSAEEVYGTEAIVFRVTIEEALRHQHFESDPLRIKQVLNNLIVNAFKFTQKGRIEVSAQVVGTDGKRMVIALAVQDTGIGISAERQKDIFQEFTQAEPDTQKQYGGYGLGLAISKKLAKLLEGHLEVQSTIGEGSTFTLTLSLLPIANEKIPKTTVETQASQPLSVVVFDDDPALRTLLLEQLKSQGAEAWGFENLEAFKNNLPPRYDVVITDIQMPEANGFDILRELQEGKVSLHSNQPIIAMTGNREFPQQLYLDKGFASVLQKPFTREMLWQTLVEVVPEQNRFSVSTTPNVIDAAPGNAPFQLEALRAFVGSDQGVTEVLTIFIEQTQKDLCVLQKAAEQDDRAQLRDTAHRMLTMARQLQAVPIIPLLEKLENSSDTAEKKLVMEWVGALQIAAKRLLEKLKTSMDA